MIRNAVLEDMKEIREVFDCAKEYMDATGNTTQWAVGHPPTSVLEDDIEKDALYVLEDEEGICGVFMFRIDEDPCYKKIEGEWRNDETYGVIHRVAANGRKKGIFKKCVEFCKPKCKNLRIDTHKDNETMKYAIQKAGFEYCGVVYMEDGSPRFAYHMVQ